MRFIYIFVIFHVAELFKRLDDKTEEIKKDLNKTLGCQVSDTLEKNTQLFADLRPALEQITATCLSENNGRKCNVGDINCTEINLLDKKVDCIKCVDGALTPDTDNGTKDYCSHNVSVKTAHLNITVHHKDEGLSFTTINGAISGFSANTTHNVQGNQDCKCSQAFYTHTNFGNFPITAPISNRLLLCSNDACNLTKWFCLATEKENEGICDVPIATCDLKIGTIPACSLNGPLQNETEVQFTNTCTSEESPGIVCKFLLHFDRNSVINKGRNVYFNIEWSKNLNITDFSCIGAEHCHDISSICIFELENKIYRYNFFTCELNKTKKPNLTASPTPSPSPTLTPDDNAKPTTWLILIIVILAIVFLLYVGYQNYQKVSFHV